MTTVVIFVLSVGGSSVGNLALLGAEPGATSSSSSGQLNWVRKGSRPAQVTTQHSLSVAQPINSRGSVRVADNSPVTVLRWRTPGVAQTQLSGNGTAQPAKFVTVTGPQHQQNAVRQVSATDLDLPAAVPDAFDDPFEDGARRPQAPRLAPAPLKIEPAAQLINEQPTAIADASWQEDPAPQPQLSPEMETPAQTLPEPESNSTFDEPEAENGESCDRVYNRRDCCADGERCVHARDKWRRDAISKISLDITPSMHPEELDPIAQEEERNRDLAQSPVRTWQDRQGNVLAEGRLTNIQRGRLLILDPNNQIVRIPFNDLCDDDLCFLTAWWRVPTECTFGEEQFAGRDWAPSTLTWKASALCHKPLYFEEEQLERYGHTAGPIKQPLLSGAHFFASLITVPYQAGINPPWECQYALGHYRPGSCAPWLLPPVPLSVRGALWEAGAVVGGVAIFP